MRRNLECNPLALAEELNKAIVQVGGPTRALEILGRHRQFRSLTRATIHLWRKGMFRSNNVAAKILDAVAILTGGKEEPLTPRHILEARKMLEDLEQFMLDAIAMARAAKKFLR